MDKQEKQYTQEEISKMNYWELWGLRRKPGLWYFMILLGIYTFLLYVFFKVIYIFATKTLDLGFHVDLWAIPLCLIVGPIYYYIHEYIYKKKHLPKNE